MIKRAGINVSPAEVGAILLLAGGRLRLSESR